MMAASLNTPQTRKDERPLTPPDVSSSLAHMTIPGKTRVCNQEFRIRKVSY